MGPVAILSCSRIPAQLVSSPLCRGSTPEVYCRWGPQEGSGQGRCLVLGLRAGARAVASVCVFVHKHASSCLLLPPKGNGLQTEQGLGEGTLKALTVDFPLLMIFLLVFCLLGILPVLYICMVYIVVSLLLSVCCVLCSVKHTSRATLLVGFVWLLEVTCESNRRAFL